VDVAVAVVDDEVAVVPVNVDVVDWVEVVKVEVVTVVCVNVVVTM
jgi:hypothetical protein